MSEDADPESKTEDPSGKRLSDAAEKGNVAKSMEISYWFTFLAASIALWMLADSLSSRVVSATTVFFAQPHLIPVDPSHLARLAVDMMMDLGIVLSPVLGLFVLLLVGYMLLSEGGHLAHLTFFGFAIEPMAKSTFYFVLGTLVIVEVIQSRYQKRILDEQDRGKH